MTNQPPLCVAVASDLSLIAQSVRAAISGQEAVEAFVLTWPGSRWVDELASGRPDVALLICDLRQPDIRAQACHAVGRRPPPWVVMSGQEPAPTWGAVLGAGAELVVPNTTSLRQVTDDLRAVARGDAVVAADRRRELLDLWWADRTQLMVLRERMQMLSPRESTVLRELYAGRPVAQIATALEISEATVRSQVKAVLRKLQVSSQLAAVAALDHLCAEPGR